MLIPVDPGTSAIDPTAATIDPTAAATIDPSAAPSGTIDPTASPSATIDPATASSPTTIDPGPSGICFLVGTQQCPAENRGADDDFRPFTETVKKIPSIQQPFFAGINLLRIDCFFIIFHD